MTERIEKELIKKGLEKGIITFDMEDDLLIARIGDNWFFISSDYDKTEKDYSTQKLIDMIYKTVNDEPINSDDEDDAAECLYYKYYLEEQLEENNGKK